MPAIHRNRSEIRDLFARTIAPGLTSDDPSDLAEASRLYLRERFLTAKVGVSGANFGDRRDRHGLRRRVGGQRADVHDAAAGARQRGRDREARCRRFADLEVFLQLLPRSSTGERMNPYTSLWTGVTAGDGPQELHVVLLDNGRTRVLEDEVGRQALHCIRCSACLNVCPVYSRTGGHAYGSVYPGPIGAILTPQLIGIENATSLPFASSLCGACYEVCPVKIDIPTVLLHLRRRVVEASAGSRGSTAMRLAAWIIGSRRRFALAERFAAVGSAAFARRRVIRRLPDRLARLDTQPRPESAGGADLPRLVARDETMTSARDEILARIRATSRVEPTPVFRTYRRDSDSYGR